MKVLKISFFVSFLFLFVSNCLFSCYISHFSKDRSQKENDDTSTKWKKFKIINMFSFDETTAYDVSDDCRYVALGYENNKLHVYDLNKRDESNIIYEYAFDSACSELKFYPCGNYILSGHEDGAFILHDIKNEETILSYKYESEILHLIFSHNYRYIISAYDDGSIVAHDAKKDVQFFKMEHGHNDADGYKEVIKDLQLSENDAYIASFCECGLLRLFDIQEEKEIHVSLGGSISRVLFSVDSKTLILAFESGRVIVIDLKKLFTLALRRDINLDDDRYKSCWWHFFVEEVLEDENALIKDLCLSKNDRFLIAGGLSKKIYFYDLKTRKSVLDLSLAEVGEEDEFSYFINSLHFSEDENALIVVGTKVGDDLAAKGFIKICNLQKDRFGVVKNYSIESIYFASEPYDFCFSRYKNCLAVMGFDLNVFDLKRKECLLTSSFSFGRTLAKFSPDSDRFIVLDEKYMYRYKTSNSVYYDEKRQMLVSQQKKSFYDKLLKSKTKKKIVDCFVSHSPQNLEETKDLVGNKRRRKTVHREENQLYPFKKTKRQL